MGLTLERSDVQIFVVDTLEFLALVSNLEMVVRSNMSCLART